jgi:serine/threonine protein kinase
MIGKTVGNRYRIVEKAGEGGMGTVYKAFDTVLRRDVALKMLHPSQCSETKVKSRFEIEAVVTANLNHPSIVTLHDFFTEEDRFFIVMQYLEGKTVKDLLQEQGPLPQETLVFILEQVIDGLAYAHDQNVIHRDIKPNNIMVTNAGPIKILDFGIARSMGHSDLTETGMTLGSTSYMSPEQIRGENLDQRSDIYSLGITLFEMATGRQPFAGPNVSQFDILTRQIHTELPSPRAINPAISVGLSHIITKCAQKKPEARYQNLKELRRALRESLSSAETKLEIKSWPKRDEPLSQKPSDSRKTKGVLRGLLQSKEGAFLVAVILMVMGVGGYLLFKKEASGPSPTISQVPVASNEAAKLPIAKIPALTDTAETPTEPTTEIAEAPAPSHEKAVALHTPLDASGTQAASKPEASGATETPNDEVVKTLRKYYEESKATTPTAIGKPAGGAAADTGGYPTSEPGPAPVFESPSSAVSFGRFQAYYIRKGNAPVELKDAEALNDEDRYFLNFFPIRETYLYIAQVDSNDVLSVIFPNGDFSSAENPLQPGKAYRFPENPAENFALSRDLGHGKEVIYLITNSRPNEQLELIFRGILKGDRSQILEAPREFRTIINDQAVADVNQIWFWHL